jgi:F0F1-type ATP synthase membrane subunit b/b'
MTSLSIRHAAAGCAVVAVGALGGAIAGCSNDDVKNAQDQVNSVNSQIEKTKTDVQNQVNKAQDQADKIQKDANKQLDKAQKKADEIQNTVTSK